MPMRRILDALPLPPRQVVAVSADGSTSAYRLGIRFDGGVKLVPGRLLAGRDTLVVLDPTVVYRRRLQGRSRLRRARKALLTMAPELFPFDPATTRYAISEMRSEIVASALPGEVLDRLTSGVQRVRSVIAAESDLSLPGILDAIERWLAAGSSEDFLGSARRPVPVSLVVTASLAVAVTLILGSAAWLMFLSGWQDRYLQSTARELEPEARPLLARYAVLERMTAAQAALAELHGAPGAAAHARAVELLSSVPRGVSIRRVEFKGGVLEVSGTGGAEAREWLVKHGFPASQIEMLEAAAYRHYSARVKLGG